MEATACVFDLNREGIFVHPNPCNRAPFTRDGANQCKAFGHRGVRGQDRLPQEVGLALRSNVGQLGTKSRAFPTDRVAALASLALIHGSPMVRIAAYGTTLNGAQRPDVCCDLRDLPLGEEPEGRHTPALIAIRDVVDKRLVGVGVAQFGARKRRTSATRSADSMAQSALRFKRLLARLDVIRRELCQRIGFRLGLRKGAKSEHTGGETGSNSHAVILQRARNRPLQRGIPNSLDWN